ncbi:hypothetical protein ACSBR2_016028 [Camellia fascicularis]
MRVVTSSMAAKFVFFLPNPPSYTVTVDESTGKMRITDVSERKKRRHFEVGHQEGY